MTDPQYRIASIWRRLAALGYDTLILLAISFLYGAVATGIGVLLGWHDADYQPMFRHWLFTLGWALSLAAFYIWFWHKSGQTIGMRAWRLKLVERSHPLRTPPWHLCGMRALISPPIIILGGIAYWYKFINARGDCLHDKLSHTQVIELPKKASN